MITRWSERSLKFPRMVWFGCGHLYNYNAWIIEGHHCIISLLCLGLEAKDQASGFYIKQFLYIPVLYMNILKLLCGIKIMGIVFVTLFSFFLF